MYLLRLLPMPQMSDIAIAQDLIYATTHGRVKTPKHIGLAMSARHLTGSKLLVTMLNRFGHCCSYDDIEVVDTTLALDIIASSENLGAVVPSNISPGVFVQVARDNNDINEETLDGKQTTCTVMPLHWSCTKESFP